MADMRKAFLADIVENIDDDTPRLVFADWLEENGDPDRAEFIRIQCEEAASRDWVPPWNPEEDDRIPIDSRGHALLEKHGAEWMKEAPKWATKRFGYFRGFVARVEATGSDWLRGAAGLYRRVPVEGLELRSGDDRFLEAFAARPECGYLRLLNLSGFGNSAASLAGFFATADLRRLVTLDYNVAGMGQLASLLNAARLPRLWCLHLRGGVGVAGAFGLANSGLLRNLKSLELSVTQVCAEGIAALADSQDTSGLEELSLWSNQVGSEGLVSLAASPHLSNLRRLHLGNDSIQEAGVVALATSPYLTNLTDLYLQTVGEFPALADAISESESLIHLRRLHLNNSDCGDILARLAERRERGIE